MIPYEIYQAGTIISVRQVAGIAHDGQFTIERHHRMPVRRRLETKESPDEVIHLASAGMWFVGFQFVLLLD
jgi:hypothetical protein